MKLKICGMKQNVSEVAALQPDFLGFIFWKHSLRFFDQSLAELPSTIKKVGVFVDEEIDEIIAKVEYFNFELIQLHGSESAAYCTSLKAQLKNVQLIKVFAIKDKFDFKIVKPFEGVCDYFLFDTKGELPGGNGYSFRWDVLKEYPSSKPYFLSGGIGLEDADKLKKFFSSPESKHCYAIDVNSRFEILPGLKDIEKLKEFQNLITAN